MASIRAISDKGMRRALPFEVWRSVCVEPKQASPLEGGSSTASLNLGWHYRVSGVLSVAAWVSLFRRRDRSALGATAGLLLLFGSSYALVCQRRGRAAAFMSLPLHALHHEAGALSLPLGAAAYLVRRPHRAAGRLLTSTRGARLAGDRRGLS
jgi:hypothetical protein